MGGDPSNNSANSQCVGGTPSNNPPNGMAERVQRNLHLM